MNKGKGVSHFSREKHTDDGGRTKKQGKQRQINKLQGKGQGFPYHLSSWAFVYSYVANCMRWLITTLKLPIIRDPFYDFPGLFAALVTFLEIF